MTHAEPQATPPLEGGSNGVTPTLGRIRAVAVAVGLVVVGLVVANLVGAVPLVVELALTGEVLVNPVASVATVVLTMLGYAAVALLYARGRLAIPAVRPSRRHLGLAVAAVVGMLVINIAGQYVASLAGLQAAPSSITLLIGETPELLLVFAVVALLLNGPAEELLFRGAVQGRLRKAFGPAAAIVGASALFASIHLFAVVGALGAGLVSVALIFGISLALGALYERTGNVVVPALAHGAYNAVLFVTAYVAIVSGF
jgi:hypothetical protein